MSEEKSSEDFKIRIGDESPDSSFQDEIRELRLEKLSKRVTFISILIPCLIAVVLAFTYLDLRKRVMINQNSGTETVQKISQDFDAQLYEITSKYNDLENTFATRTATLEKNHSSLKFKQYKTDNRLKKLTASKANKKDQDAVLKDLKKVSSQITAFDETFSQKLDELANSVQKTSNDLAKIHADISTLITNKLDRKVFNQKLQEEEQLQQQKLDQIKTKITSQLLAIRKEINQLEKRIALIQKTNQPPSQNSKSTGSPPTSSDSSGKQAEDTATPESGQIIEKDI
jgi:DNA repair exonuclease SbcCD ATPase subunit